MAAALSLNTVEASLPRSSRAVRRSAISPAKPRGGSACRRPLRASKRIQAAGRGHLPASTTAGSWRRPACGQDRGRDAQVQRRAGLQRERVQAAQDHEFLARRIAGADALRRIDGGGRPFVRGARRGACRPRARPSPRPAATRARESASRPARRRAGQEFVARIGDRRQACHGGASGGRSVPGGAWDARRAAPGPGREGQRRDGRDIAGRVPLPHLHRVRAGASSVSWLPWPLRQLAPPSSEYCQRPPLSGRRRAARRCR